jgi:hypothetical protein
VITADEVVDALHPLLYDIVRLSDRVRLVGTASSALRGIELPVGDVDVLAKDRETVDELVTVSGSPPATLIETPFGLPVSGGPPARRRAGAVQHGREQRGRFGDGLASASAKRPGTISRW